MGCICVDLIARIVKCARFLWVVGWDWFCLLLYVMLWLSTLRDEDDTTSSIFFCEDVFRV